MNKSKYKNNSGDKSEPIYTDEDYMRDLTNPNGHSITKGMSNSDKTTKANYKKDIKKESTT